MKTVSVTASKKYDVLIDRQLLPKIGDYIASLKPGCSAAIISDSNVWPLYGETVQQSLEKAGIRSVHYVFTAGEASKNANTYLQILNFLAENQITRTDMILALGGGVVGDMAGFAAATYLRGIAYIQVPTTLLAMVDSSVGGKTAIDLPAGKNLAGAFKQPELVLCDTDTLTTLPEDFFTDGCAEIIKYCMLYDAEMIRYLCTVGCNFDREAVIDKCVGYKRDVVCRDEFDTGERQKLNLGHTIGHGIEKASCFQITHGQAVAAGMAIVTKAAVQFGLCEQCVYDELQETLNRFSLPSATDLPASILFSAALSDKKRVSDNINLIVPRRIGQCDIIAMPIEKLESFIKAGL